MLTKIVRNERSWVIDIISKINEVTSNNNLSIKRAGGENTIRINGTTMFPDILLYGNTEQSVILQGWEAKMPDVPINDPDFIADAQRKARALNLNSCVLWNFTYVHLYILNEKNNQFEIFHEWTDTCFIKTRDAVQKHREKWEKLLENVILDLSQLFNVGKIEQTNFEEVLSNNILYMLITRNKDIVADSLRDNAVSNTHMEAYIDNWWISTKNEYKYDEDDKYKAYAKNIILNWSNRIIFAHMIKKWQIPAYAVEKITPYITPQKANDIFKEITEQCDFFNIFSAINYDTFIPSNTWKDFTALSVFLKDNTVNFVDQTILQHVLENTVNSAKREMNGIFTTPVELAKLLVLITIKNWREDVIDPCCGTGTIAREVLKEKKNRLDVKQAISTVWASDKNQFSLQVANISMAEHDTIFLPNKIFKHNALSLCEGETIKIVDPVNGKKTSFKLPKFGCIVSNLPFVAFDNIPEDDIKLATNIPYFSELDKRSDLYSYIALALSNILKEKGQLGIITSNSWLATKAGNSFITALTKLFSIKQVHISGKGRWFKNADVVTTIIILEKLSNSQPNDTLFYLWKKTLDELETNDLFEKHLVLSSILEKELYPNIVKISRYSQNDIHMLKQMNLSYNALFHNVNWLADIADKTIEIKDVFKVTRGSRRGWDQMFYPATGHCIEKQYIRNVLINAKNVKRLVTNADQDAFCCGKKLNELKAEGSVGTIAWIKQFETQVNGVGKKLPSVLAKKNMQWYELQDKEIVDIFTMMNPDRRFFFARFHKPSFINQRLIGLTKRNEYDDIELEHALLNSVFTIFYIEASGFARGLGALDINSENIAKCRMLNPKLISSNARNNIIKAFKPLLKRDIKTIREELISKDRMIFEKTVMYAFGIENYLAPIIYSLLSMQNARLCTKGEIEPLNLDSMYGYQEIGIVAESSNPYI